MATSWSGSQKSIALSSCESEYLASVGGAAEGLFVARLWEFLVKKEVKVELIGDSSSCRAFAQRQRVGRLKHVETKYLWLQLSIKDGLLEMKPIPTLFNIADLGTKNLTRARRAFLVYLMNVVKYSEETKCYVAVGEDDYNERLRKKVWPSQ